MWRKTGAEGNNKDQQGTANTRARVKKSEGTSTVCGGSGGGGESGERAAKSEPPRTANEYRREGRRIAEEYSQKGRKKRNENTRTQPANGKLRKT